MFILSRMLESSSNRNCDRRFTRLTSGDQLVPWLLVGYVGAAKRSPVVTRGRLRRGGKLSCWRCICGREHECLLDRRMGTDGAKHRLVPRRCPTATRSASSSRHKLAVREIGSAWRVIQTTSVHGPYDWLIDWLIDYVYWLHNAHDNKDITIIWSNADTSMTQDTYKYFLWYTLTIITLKPFTTYQKHYPSKNVLSQLILNCV